jgi:hypothetical protein
MTDSIDLDEMDTESDDEPDANRGDWLWRGEGDPDAEPDGSWFGDGAPDRAGTDDADALRTSDGEGQPSAEGEEAGSGTDSGEDADSGTDSSEQADSGNDSLPGVPRANHDRPVGVPVEGGGAGGGAADRDEAADSAVDRGGSGAGEMADQPAGADAGAGSASGPHGGGVDDMTMALTYDAARRLADPRFAVIDAKGWADWIGIVGDVPAHQINAFQREHQIDADFFSGAGQEPAERLADVDEHSMFYAERMVLVGVDGEQAIAERAGWEFVPLETAAEKADWDLSDDA